MSFYRFRRKKIEENKTIYILLLKVVTINIIYFYNKSIFKNKKDK